SEEHTSELQSLTNLVCRLLLEKRSDHYFMLRAIALALRARLRGLRWLRDIFGPRIPSFPRTGICAPDNAVTPSHAAPPEASRRLLPMAPFQGGVATPLITRPRSF